MNLSARPVIFIMLALLVILPCYPGTSYSAAIRPSLDSCHAIYTQEKANSDKPKPLHLRPYIIQFTVISADDPNWTYDSVTELNTRLISLKATITDIIKGKPDVPAGTEINVTIKQKEAPGGFESSCLGLWSSVDLQINHSYIIFSDSSANNIQSLFDNAVDIYDMQGAEYVKADITFIQETAHKSIPDQATSLANYIRASKTTLSRYIARYCLEIASDRLTPADSDLYEVLATLKYQKYDEATKVRLYSGMRIRVKREMDTNDVLCGTVALIVVRNIGSITSGNNPNAVQEDALRNGMPWLLSSAEGIKYIQKNMAKSEKDEMAKTIGILCESQYIKGDYKIQLKEIANIIVQGP